MHAVNAIMRSLLKFGVSTKGILLITFYTVWRCCWEQLFKAWDMSIQSVMMKSVDTSCRWQPPFVILDCVTPGGVRHPLDFFKDEKCLNVILLRAEDGLIVVSSKKMIQKQCSINSVWAWMSIINHTFMVDRGHFKIFGDDTEIWNLLKVPGPMYEEAPLHRV